MFSLSSSGAHRDPHSFPTRRSSDLTVETPVVESSSAPGGWTIRQSGFNILLERPDPFLRITLKTPEAAPEDRKSTRLNSSHRCISYAVFCLKKKSTNSFMTLN